ncbi:MAG: Bug family tripartite tricarboxylate transporter substrate binding protein [Burkholderiales bacterium]
MNLQIRFIAFSAALVIAAQASAQSENFPAKPVRFIVPYAAGGNGDVVSRILGAKLAPAMGQQFVIENRGGAGGNIGAELAARAAPDGYTIMLGTNTHAINMSLYSKPGYDLVRDFAPISLVSAAPMVLMVHPSLPVKSVRELVALAESQPGKLNYGSGGSGSSPHILMELLKTQAGIDLVHVPYKGVAQSMTDLMAGNIQIMFNATSTALDHIKTKRVKGLAISSAKRSALAPDMPTVAESGVPGFEAMIWQGVLAPAGSPAALIERLNREVGNALASAEVIKQFRAAGVVPMGSTPGEFQSYIKSEIAKWAKVVKASGAKVD